MAPVVSTSWCGQFMLMDPHWWHRNRVISACACPGGVVVAGESVDDEDRLDGAALDLADGADLERERIEVGVKDAGGRRWSLVTLGGRFGQACHEACM